MREMGTDFDTCILFSSSGLHCNTITGFNTVYTCTPLLQLSTCDVTNLIQAKPEIEIAIYESTFSRLEKDPFSSL